MLDWRPFPGFRSAFEPSSIEWDVDPDMIEKQAEAISGGVNVEGKSDNLHVVCISCADLEFCESLQPGAYLPVDLTRAWTPSSF